MARRRLYCVREESAEVGVPALAGILVKEPPKGGTPAGHFKPVRSIVSVRFWRCQVPLPCQDSPFSSSRPKIGRAGCPPCSQQRSASFVPETVLNIDERHGILECGSLLPLWPWPKTVACEAG